MAIHCVTLKNKISMFHYKFKELFTLNFEEINPKKEDEQVNSYFYCVKKELKAKPYYRIF